MWAARGWHAVQDERQSVLYTATEENAVHNEGQVCCTQLENGVLYTARGKVNPWDGCTVHDEGGVILYTTRETVYTGGGGKEP